MKVSEDKSVLSREEMKKIKRRRAKARAAVLTCFVILILVIVAAILLRTVLFPIDTISVSGNETITSAQIIDGAGIIKGDKLFSISESKINKILTVKYPYIKKVDLKYPSFNELRLEISETVDVFCYETDKGYFTADADNKILSKNVIKPENLVLLTVKSKINPECGYLLKLQDNEFEDISKIYNYLTREDIVVNAINVKDVNFITLKIQNRFEVSFGALTDFEGKLEHLRGMLPQIDAKNGSDITGEIDLSSWSATKREGFFKPKTLQ